MSYIWRGAWQGAVLAADARFISPLEGPVKEWGFYAHKRTSQSPVYSILEHWYEALRILVVSWEEAPDAAIAFLQMNKVLNSDASLWPSSLQPDLIAFEQDFGAAKFPRFERLKDVLLYQAGKRDDFRGILFVQQRVMTHIIDYTIRQDSELSAHFTPVCIYATSSPATATLSVSKRDTHERLAAFKAGSANLLIATAVAEEGLDVQEANCVIRFDPVQHAVSFVQGRGRARQADSSFIIMSEQEGRSIESLAQAEKQQLDIAHSFQPGPAAGDHALAITAQKSRESNAHGTLSEASLTADTAVLALNLYCRKTKVVLEENSFREGSDWVCFLTYASILRNISAQASSETKKDAKKHAAQEMLVRLQETIECP